MASIDLVGVWLCRMSAISVQYKLTSDENMDVRVSSRNTVEGDYRVAAGGRVRLITNDTLRKSASVSVTYANRDVREDLEELKGGLLMYRDYRGRLLYGSYLALDADEQPGAESCDLGFDFDEITHSVVV